MPDQEAVRAAREMTPDEIEKRDAMIVEHLALLITASGRGINYTAALDMAEWMFAEAARCGWFLYV